MKYLHTPFVAAWLVAGLAWSQTAPVAAADAVTSADSSAPSGPGAVAQALRQGGYVVYFRHTATDFSKNDAASTGYGDCGNQRLLLAAGKKAATAIGQQVRALKLPATKVRASPMCRTMDTAQRMLGRATQQPDMREGEVGGIGGGGDYPGLKPCWLRPSPRVATAGWSATARRFGPLPVRRIWRRVKPL